MDAAAGSADADGVLEVEHFVVEEVFDGVAGAGGSVEDLADDDGVVGGVVVAEEALGVMLAPGELGTAEEVVEEALVEGVEDLVEVVVAAFGAEDALGSSGGAHLFGLAGNGLGVLEAFVAVIVGLVDGLLVDFGDEDVGDGVEDGFWGAFEEVGEGDVELALAQADGGVERDKSAEADGEGGHGSAWPEGAVLVLKDGGDFGAGSGGEGFGGGFGGFGWGWMAFIWILAGGEVAAEGARGGLRGFIRAFGAEEGVEHLKQRGRPPLE